ncbi:hypothetical protein B0T09DRAFT_67069 [Sordaria sp. MPI-SDFR-AT-0083]|nr:hypothetical protein B0T09DRAFT_67069 [Sordaria sp. MPI-SDFR-AT-0083]
MRPEATNGLQTFVCPWIHGDLIAIFACTYATEPVAVHVFMIMMRIMPKRESTKWPLGELYKTSHQQAICHCHVVVFFTSFLLVSSSFFMPHLHTYVLHTRNTCPVTFCREQDDG